MATIEMKRFASRTLELAAVLVLVLMFFLIFLGVLGLVFPSGLGFKDLMQRGGIFGSDELELNDGKGQRLDGNVVIDAGKTRSETVAILAEKQKLVKNKRAKDIAWHDAYEGMELQDKDAIQTFNESSALVKFNNDSHIRVQKNSLVVIRGLEHDAFIDNDRSFLMVVEGELEGKVVQRTGDAPLNLEVKTPTGVANVRSGKNENGEIEFKIKVNPDQSSTVAVYSGVAEFMSELEKISVKSGQAVTINADNTVEKVQALPRAPEILGPDARDKFYYREMPPKINFTWQTEEKVDKYHLVMAKTPKFEDLIVDEILDTPEFTHGNLKAGKYYWRVSAIKSWGESRYSKPQSITLIQDLEPPTITVDLPPDILHEHVDKLTGMVKNATTLYIDDLEIPFNNDGRFEYDLPPRQGTTVVVIKAFDSAGNFSYQTRTLRSTN